MQGTRQVPVNLRATNARVAEKLAASGTYDPHVAILSRSVHVAERQRFPRSGHGPGTDCSRGLRRPLVTPRGSAVEGGGLSRSGGYLSARVRPTAGKGGKSVAPPTARKDGQVQAVLAGRNASEADKRWIVGV